MMRATVTNICDACPTCKAKKQTFYTEIGKSLVIAIEELVEDKVFVTR